MKNVFDFETSLNYAHNKNRNIHYFSNRNMKNNINIKDDKTINNIYQNYIINNNLENKNKNNNEKIKYNNLNNIWNSKKAINKNNVQNNTNKSSDFSKLNFHFSLSNSESETNIINNKVNDSNNNSKNQLLNKKEINLIKLEQLKNDLIELSSEIIINKKYNKNHSLNIKNKIIKEEKQKLLSQIKNKEQLGQNIIKYEKQYNHLSYNNIQANKYNFIFNQNENKLMDNLIKEMNKKNNQIYQLKKKINILDISLDSSLIKNKELSNYINILKKGLEKLKTNIDNNSNIINISNKLIIEHAINLIFVGENNDKFKDQKYSLQNYKIVSDKKYKNLKWFLLKNKNNKSNNYTDYIWVDKKHLLEEKKDINEEKNKLFKFLYHSHNLKNKDYKYIIKDEINKEHSLLISNVINNQYFVFNYKKIDEKEGMSKSYSFNRKSDNNIIYQKLININKLEKTLNIENNDLKKLDNLTISNIYQENNEEQNSLINDIKNINNDNNRINILDQNNEFKENKILNDEAFLKTYNSTELELEAAKNQLIFIKNELRDLSHRFDVVKYSFINLFGKINFPKKNKIEIIQILKLLGVDDNKISFIFDYK